MNIYKLHLYTREEGQAGFEFFSNRADALKAQTRFLRDNKQYTCDPEIEKIFVGQTRDEILKALNEHAGHPNNG